MKQMGVNEIRENFLSFFESKKHTVLPSASLVPVNDNSLLLVNSGMAPLKPFFTGQEIPVNKRVASCQKCIRTGDIENVGKTARHGTFFEMLGNFSFGDYFKEEIIPWSYEYVIDVLKMPEDKIFVTVYQDDDEALNIWHEKVGVPKEKIFKMGKADNFWEHGLGPCGPCSELYYDRGEEFGCGSPDCTVGCECDRYMEFWNLVFTQFNKEEDGSYSNLKNPNIDTGMGLERMAAIMQNVESIFDVDTVKAVRDEVCKKAAIKYKDDDKKDVSVRVITDHIRSVTFMTADGVLPSNEGRGYVLRRLLRRAARHGKLLGINDAFLVDLSMCVMEHAKDAYPELHEKRDYILKVISVEENSFYKTIDKGNEILKADIEKMKSNNEKIMNGELSFKLYDTYGFPIDLTKEILEEEGLELDLDAFNKEMQLQKERARNARAESTYMGASETVYNKIPADLITNFNGHDVSSLDNSKIVTLVVNGEIENTASAGDSVSIFLDTTPFYAESGGQVGDCGIIKTDIGNVLVEDCIKVVGGKIAHIGTVTEGSISVNDTVFVEIDNETRMSTARNHTATHLLQKALRTILGTHVEQAGSFVSSKRLRFDFTHFQGLTVDEINEIEAIVNKSIFESLAINITEETMENARKLGAMALFGEKYKDLVRVVNMSGYSIELCGGSHLKNSSEIGSFKIISESGVASGVRRIEALTGIEALKYYQQQDTKIKKVCEVLKCDNDNMFKKLENVLQTQKELSKEIEAMKSKLAGGAVADILNNVKTVNDVSVIVAEIANVSNINDLRTLGDDIKNRLNSGVVVLASGETGKINFIAMATDDVVKKGIHCGNIIKEMVLKCDGKGGGKPNMAQAGAKDYSKLNEAFDTAFAVIENSLN